VSSRNDFMKMCLTCTAAIVIVGSTFYLQKCSEAPQEQVIEVGAPTPIDLPPGGENPIDVCSDESCLETPEDFELRGLDYINAAVNRDLTRLSSAQQRDTRYGVNTHKLNQQESDSALQVFGTALDRAFNGISFESRLHLGRYIDQDETIVAYDLDELGLTAADWDQIVENTDMILPDNTQLGLFNQQLTGATNPWLFGDAAIFSAHWKPDQYNDHLNLAQTAGEELIKAGVDFESDLQDIEATMVGITSSQIGFNFRLMMRFEADEGFWRQTCDPNPDDGTFANLAEFPLPFEAGPENAAVNSFDCFAFMFISQLPNGLPYYGLYALGATEVIDEVTGDVVVINTVNNAIIQEAAPVNLVRDTSPRFAFDAEIENGGDCAKCHSAGATGAYVGAENDRIRDIVLANRGDFAIADQNLILGSGGLIGLYTDDATRQKLVEEDNDSVAEALKDLGIDPRGDEPMNVYIEGYRQDYDLRRFCGFIMSMATGFDKLSDCLEIIDSAAASRLGLGQLRDGGVITLEALIEIFPDLVIDFQLGQDPVGVEQ